MARESAGKCGKFRLEEVGCICKNGGIIEFMFYFDEGISNGDQQCVFNG